VCYENVEITLEAGAHTVHNLYYHVMWVPKYRRSILQGKVGERAKQVIHQVADEYGYTLARACGRSACIPRVIAPFQVMNRSMTL